MSETKKMINIINQNRDKVYNHQKQIIAQKKARKAFVSDLIGVGLEAILFLTFINVISKLITG